MVAIVGHVVVVLLSRYLKQDQGIRNTFLEAIVGAGA